MQKNKTSKQRLLQDELNDDVIRKLQQAQKQIQAQEQKKKAAEKARKLEEKKQQEKRKSFEELLNETSLNWRDFK